MNGNTSSEMFDELTLGNDSTWFSASEYVLDNDMFIKSSVYPQQSGSNSANKKKRSSFALQDNDTIDHESFQNIFEIPPFIMSTHLESTTAENPTSRKPAIKSAAKPASQEYRSDSSFSGSSSTLTSHASSNSLYSEHIDHFSVVPSSSTQKLPKNKHSRVGSSDSVQSVPHVKNPEEQSLSPTNGKRKFHKLKISEEVRENMEQKKLKITKDIKNMSIERLSEKQNLPPPPPLSLNQQQQQQQQQQHGILLPQHHQSAGPPQPKKKKGKGKSPSNNLSSIFRGVSCCGKDRKWQARIRDGSKVHYLGRYNSEIEAALVYDKSAREFKGLGATQNFTLEVAQSKDLREEIIAATAKNNDKLPQEYYKFLSPSALKKLRDKQAKLERAQKALTNM